MIPNFLDESMYTLHFNRVNHYVMSANFNAYMNFEGLKWFVNSVWDGQIDRNHKLFLVGRKSIEAFNRVISLYYLSIALKQAHWGILLSMVLKKGY